MARVLEECGVGEWTRDDVLECVVRLNESWCTGLAGYFAESGCVDIEWVIRDCLFSSCDQVCEEPADAGDFDLDRFLSNCCILIYIGVRFD